MNLKILTAYVLLILAIIGHTNSASQFIGTYEIKESDKNLASTCSDFSRSEIVYTESEFSKGQRDTAGNFEWAREYIDRYIKSQDQADLVDLGVRTCVRYLFIVIFVPISLLSLIFFFIYFVCKACCSTICIICGCISKTPEAQ